MTLVDRLRAAAPGTMLSMQVNDLAALREAADEIERLRAALKPFADAVIPKGPERYTFSVDPGDIPMRDLIQAYNAYQQSPLKDERS